tara:strand:+ start:63 stop:506 length:444 start_codon:yes stop_codon:yes gene_type:complete
VNYSVGQTIYLLSRKDVKVFPAKVIEEIKRRTIKEEMISYIIRLPNKDMSEVLLEEIDADIFTSIEDVEKKMIENAHSEIKSLLHETRKIEKRFVTIEDASENASEDDNGVNESSPTDKVEIDLGNGQMGRISLNQLQAEVNHGKSS